MVDKEDNIFCIISENCLYILKILTYNMACVLSTFSLLYRHKRGWIVAWRGAIAAITSLAEP